MTLQDRAKGAMLLKLKVCQSMPVLQAVAFFEHTSYDATPLSVKVMFDAQAPGAVSERENAKLYVVELCYAVVLKKLNVEPERASDAFIYLRIPTSIQVKAAERGNGENLRNVLLSASHLEDVARVAAVFTHSVRLSESDEERANLRGERLLNHAREGKFLSLHTVCCAHKVHSAARRTLSTPFLAGAVSGMINTLKVLWDRKHLGAFHRALRTLIDQQLEIHWHDGDAPPLSRGAMMYKEDILAMFSPDHSQPVLRARLRYLATTLANGDWREDVVTHHCSGCCQSREVCSQKLQKHIIRLCKSLRCSMLCRDNWSDWAAQMNFFGVLGFMHSLLKRSLVVALQGQIAAEPQDALAQHDFAPELAVEGGEAAEGDDVMEAQRREKARSLQSACAWLEGEFERSLWILRSSLDAQIHLMQTLLRKEARAHEIDELHSQMTAGHRHFNILDLHNGLDSVEMLRASLISLQDNSLAHGLFASTEQMRSQIWVATLRPAALVFQQVICRMRSMPYQMFALLEQPTRAKAEELLRLPHCMLDDFARGIISVYGTPELLLSQHCLQTLAGAASMIRGSTFKTETAHSRNRRRAFGRVQTNPIELHTLSLAHAGCAMDSWLPLPEKQHAEARQRAGAEGGQAEGDAPAPKRRRGGGGPWRAFLHMHGNGMGQKMLHMPALSQQYHDLNPQQKMAYDQLGAAGTS